MGRVLKGIFEVLLVIVVGIIGLIASNTNPKKREKIVDSFENDLHNKYAAGEVSDMKFSEGLDKIENARKKIK